MTTYSLVNISVGFGADLLANFLRLAASWDVCASLVGVI